MEEGRLMSNPSSNERITQKLSHGKEKKSKTGILAIIVIAIIIVGLVILILFFTKAKTTNRRNVVVTPDNVEEILSDSQDKRVTAGTYEVTMNTTWNFDKGDSASSDAYVENSTANTNDVYFDIIRSDTNETIFTSPTIPVGSHLENITLDKALGKGTHDCMLTYHLLDDAGNATIKLNLKLTIHVKS